ncbi:hypothetical protein M3J09_011719 [Ascochyta lentis]
MPCFICSYTLRSTVNVLLYFDMRHPRITMACDITIVGRLSTQR